MKFQPIPIGQIKYVPSPPKKMDLDQIHPAKVRPLPDGTFEVVDGHGRIDVARTKGEDEIWCQVEEMDDLDFHLQSLAANMGVRDNPMKKALDIRYLIEIEGLPQIEIAKMVGVSQPEISQLHKLNSLIPELQERLLTGDCPKNAGLIAAGTRDQPPLPEEMQMVLATDEKPTIKLARELRNQFDSQSFSLDDLPALPIGLEEEYQPPLVLNGDTWPRLNGGETIQVEWGGLVVEVKAL
jgi:predicted XRE-type DNA-binding protein